MGKVYLTTSLSDIDEWCEIPKWHDGLGENDSVFIVICKFTRPAGGHKQLEKDERRDLLFAKMD